MVLGSIAIVPPCRASQNGSGSLAGRRTVEMPDQATSDGRRAGLEPPGGQASFPAVPTGLSSASDPPPCEEKTQPSCTSKRTGDSYYCIRAFGFKSGSETLQTPVGQTNTSGSLSWLCSKCGGSKATSSFTLPRPPTGVYRSSSHIFFDWAPAPEGGVSELKPYLP